ncbi:D-Ala-D-Ala carboxypeptidase family metallohydrolase [Dysgonomonas macrotermitis]|uniref:Peptidase M15 n=1 Tax=Dysgonomonas macrotermitis TaxID=1346286 RepID=A0A1M5AG12_9BACT|nr:D-Ala-D-Ala carboxypeptidase family metallohydrolase [Dysgonomonas macrotermitis]SHF29211.1 Peptidase M15 [Dysgonomonas macrotermitis]
MKLSKNFSLEELCHSNIGVANGINNKPTIEQIVNLRGLCQCLLEPIRTLAGEPIIVNSGFRNKKLNKLVGGVETSQHCKGEAADIRCNKLTARELYDLIKNSAIRVDQCILYPTFVHVSYKINLANRCQYLINKTVKL